jgi:hypothetical protein
MRLRILAPAITAAIAIAPAMAIAQPLTGLYVGAGAGVNWLQNEHLINASGSAANAALQSHFGWVAVGSVGYAPYRMVYASRSKATSATTSSHTVATLASPPEPAVEN